jgi:type I restriction enzyme S subunit
MKLGEALKMGLSKSIEIDDFSEYTIAGVQSYGKGVINRRNELGKNLNMKKYQVIEPNYLMWCKVDTKNGAFGITKEEHRGSLASTNMALAKIDIEKFNPSFLEKLFSFDFFHKNITHLSSGSTNRKYLTPKQLFEIVEIPAMSKSEQDEFISLVNKLESINLNSEIAHQLSLIKQMRQAFLREAMQGKLLKSTNIEKTGHELLAKIKAEKTQLIAEKKLKKEKELASISEDEIPFEIPEHWSWSRLGEIAELKSGNQYTYPISDSGVMYVKVGDMNIEGNEYEIKTSNVYYDEKFVKTNDLIKTGSIIFPKRGGAIATNKRRTVLNEPILVDSNTMAAIPNNNINFNYFLQWFSNVDLSKFGNEGVIPQVNNKDLNPLLIPLPPLHEQEQIVAKLEELMAYCDSLEQSIKESQGYNEKLLQQLLREALQG